MKKQNPFLRIMKKKANKEEVKKTLPSPSKKEHSILEDELLEKQQEDRFLLERREEMNHPFADYYSMLGEG